MANIKSAKKRAKQAEVHRQRNASQRSTMRTSIKSTVKLLTQGDATAAQTQFREMASALDKAARKGLIHKNTAARKKSRINKMLKTLVQGKSSATASASA